MMGRRELVHSSDRSRSPLIPFARWSCGVSGTRSVGLLCRRVTVLELRRLAAADSPG